MSKYRTAYVNARLVDPASGLDAPGGLLAEDGKIADFGAGLLADGVPEGAAVVSDAKRGTVSPTWRPRPVPTER